MCIPTAMSDVVICVSIASGTVIFITGCIGLFGSGGGQTSAWDTWIAHRTAIGQAKLAVEKVEAEHARKCPRMTDTPRDS